MARQLDFDPAGVPSVSGTTKRVIDTGDDSFYLSLGFDLDSTDEPFRFTLPPECLYASVESVQTDGTAATLTMGRAYSSGSVVLTSAKASVAGFAGEAVRFSVSIDGDGTQADFLLRFEQR
jgi:hypothetical protein